MKVPHGAWIAILDGEKFLLLRNHGDEALIDLRVLDHEAIENPPSREQGTDRPGRFDDGGVGRSAVEETDWHQLEKTRFAEEVSERLKRWALENRFDNLVIVADPHSLGTVRQALHKEVARRVIGEVDKDMAHLTIEKIEKTLTAH